MPIAILMACVINGNCPYLWVPKERVTAAEDACSRAQIDVPELARMEFRKVCAARLASLSVIPVTDDTMEALVGDTPEGYYVAGLHVHQGSKAVIFIAAEHPYSRSVLTHEFLHDVRITFFSDGSHCGPWWSEIQTSLPEECPKQ
jgi:hypothetical protein